MARTRGLVVVFPVIIGCIGLLNISRNARFQLFHTVDILQLLASGICFGIALASVVGLARRQ